MCAQRGRESDGVPPYDSESVFVDGFVRALLSDDCPLGSTCFTREFGNQTASRPDVVLVSREDEVVAVEAKLTRWRDAMHQAYRNTFFADRSYVLLPPAVAYRAAAYVADFDARNVGICAWDGVQIVVVKPAPRIAPHNIWVREMARELANKRRHRRA